jgi:PTH1 family peptidyl-tRNA hydrolase
VKLVVGLGNPGERYARTRHNVGFMVVDRLLASSEVPGSFRGSFEGQVARVRLEGADAMLLKPATFMNRSGRSVRAAAAFLQIGLEDWVVVHDDVDLDFGTVRVKQGGGSGGHRGLESCFEELGTQEFDRIRVGIGRPEADGSVTDYVLDPFDDEQRARLDDVVREAADAALTTVTAGAVAAMNRYNARRPAEGGEA